MASAKPGAVQFLPKAKQKTVMEMIEGVFSQASR